MSGGTVFISRPIPDAGIRRLKSAGVQVVVWSGDADDAPNGDELLAGAQAADVLLSLLTEPVSLELIERCPRLLGISNYAVGHDNIDLAAATAAGIPVCNTPDVLTEATADLTWALLLATARNIVRGDAFMRAGRYRRWGPSLLLGYDVSPGADGQRKTLGIVGFGRIGSAVASRACGFQMDVLVHDPSRRDRIAASENVAWSELEPLLEASDFVTLHVPLTESTHHLIGRSRLRLMRSTAILVNTSRGQVVDENALVVALREGLIAGAGLDVYENEPETAAGLTELDNVVLLPHLGSATRCTRDRMAIIAADNALAMLRGERAPFCVNPAVYEQGAFQARVTRSRSARG